MSDLEGVTIVLTEHEKELLDCHFKRRRAAEEAMEYDAGYVISECREKFFEDLFSLRPELQGWYFVYKDGEVHVMSKMDIRKARYCLRLTDWGLLFWQALDSKRISKGGAK